MQNKTCPVCGSILRINAKSCPYCGSDDETGWSTESDNYADPYKFTEEDYNELLEKEFGKKNSQNFSKKRLLIAIIVSILLILFLLNYII